VAIERDYPRGRAVEQRISAEFTDPATAYCLICGMSPGGFVTEGTGGRAREQARQHVAATGHPVVFYGPRPVYEFRPGARRHTEDEP
jgi:hypothetical protein